jgi:hypothetical protein
MMKIEFKFDSDQDKPGGILVYKAKSNTRSNHQSSIDRIIEDTLKIMRLLVAWKIERSGELDVNMALVEYGDELVLDEDKLANLYDKINDIPSGYRHTWLMYDNTVLKVTLTHSEVRKKNY